MTGAAVTGFAAAVLPLVVTPGASLALLVRHTANVGRSGAVAVIAGTVTGLFSHAALAAAGLSALVLGTEHGRTITAVLGACWLVGLGGWTWVAAGRSARTPDTGTRVSFGTAYTQSLAANALNPKAATVYLALMPRFVTTDRPLAAQFFTLAAAHAFLLTLWLLAWTVLVSRAASVSSSRRFARVAGRCAAVVLIGLGSVTLVSP